MKRILLKSNTIDKDNKTEIEKVNAIDKDNKKEKDANNIKNEDNDENEEEITASEKYEKNKKEMRVFKFILLFL